FNEMLFGGFLIYYTPGLRVFIDDRCELYGDQGLLDYADACFRDPAAIERWRQAYGFDTALAIKDSAFDHYFQNAPGWRLTQRTESGSLYAWRGPEREEQPNVPGRSPAHGP